MIPALTPFYFQCVGGFLRRYFCSISLKHGDILTLDWKGLELEAVVKKVDQRKCLVSYRPWDDTFQEWIDLTSRSVKSPKDSSNLDELPTKKIERVEGMKSASMQVAGSHPATKGNYRSKVVPLEINAKTYLTSRLSDGRIVLMDPETGLLSWSISPTTTSTAETPKNCARLPEGFIAVKDPRGEEYFFNTVNNTAQYSIPALPAKEVAENMSKINRDSVPTPWEVYFNKDGVPYFHNTESGKVRATLPKASVKENKRSESMPRPTDVKSQVPHTTRTEAETRATDSKSKILSSQTTTGENASTVVLDNSVIPDGWEIHYTDDGHPYFFCEATGESHWELPEKVAEEWWTSSSEQSRRGLG